MDNYEDKEDLWERIEADGRVVFSHISEWESNHPDPWVVSSQVIQYQNEYFCTLKAEDGEIKGPYVMLEQAVRAGELHIVNEETREIESYGLGDEALQALLVYSGVLPHTILVNGRKWHSKAGHQVVPYEHDQHIRR